jgi:nucleotide-binding universal stress UspA family protein
MITAGATGTAATVPRVVVGVDDSPQARAALHWAINWAGHTGARVQVIAAWAPPLPAVGDPGAGTAAMLTSADVEEQLQAHARQCLDAAEAGLPSGVEQILDRAVVCGDAATVLLDAAQHADLLVVGNTGRGALAGAVTGSVALRCAHHARCPIVLVPAPDSPHQH